MPRLQKKKRYRELQEKIPTYIQNKPIRIVQDLSEQTIKARKLRAV
jgi:hypothetical protein